MAVVVLSPVTSLNTDDHCGNHLTFVQTVLNLKDNISFLLCVLCVVSLPYSCYVPRPALVLGDTSQMVEIYHFLAPKHLRGQKLKECISKTFF